MSGQSLVFVCVCVLLDKQVELATQRPRDSSTQDCDKEEVGAATSQELSFEDYGASSVTRRDWMRRDGCLFDMYASNTATLTPSTVQC